MRSSDALWPHAKPTGVPEPGCIEVWLIRLDELRARMQQISTVLSQEELARSQRLRGDALRRRFIARRWARRTVLGAMLGVAPRDLVFEVGAHHKPSLATGGTRLDFNAASSGDTCLIAVRGDHPIGVDVEIGKPELVDRGTARAFMHDDELRRFDAPDSDRCDAFFRCWTRKEALLKYDGRGLSLDPRRVRVASESPVMMDVGNETFPANDPVIVDLDGLDGAYGALATSGGFRSYRLCRLMTELTVFP